MGEEVTKKSPGTPRQESFWETTESRAGGGGQLWDRAYRDSGAQHSLTLLQI